MSGIFTGIADVFSGDVRVPPGTTLADQLIDAKDDGLVLLIAKATEGGLKVPPPFVDPKFRAWSDGCATADVVFGAYHFMRNTDTGTAQAQFFFETIERVGRDPTNMFVALDFEPHKQVQPDPAIANDFVIEWEKKAGKVPWLYCDQSRAGLLAPFSAVRACPWWGAGYGVPWVTSHVLGKATIWQYLGANCTGNELPTDQQTYPISFNGIGKVDRSAFEGTSDELLEMISASAC